MRRLLPLLLLLAACSGSGGHAAPTTSTTEHLPPQLTAFLSDVRTPGTLGFTATYHVLKKLGGQETDVVVTAAPPTWEVRAGDIVVRGPAPSTADEARLSTVGVFSSFFSSGPARALAADARRSTAGAPVFTDRIVAGIPVHCVAVPQGGVVAQTACLTRDGVFGYVDNAAVHYELTSYRLTATS